MDALTALSDLVLDAASGPWALAVLLLSCIGDGLVPMVPSETVLVAQAAAAGAGGGHAVAAILLVAAVGAWGGDNLAYLVGRSIGLRRLSASPNRPRLAAAMCAAVARFERNGASVILTGRFVPVGRVAVNLAAGAIGLPYRRYAVLSALASCAWVVTTAALGLLAGIWLGDRPLVAMVVSVVVGMLVGVAIDAFTRRRRRVTPATHRPLTALAGRPVPAC